MSKDLISLTEAKVKRTREMGKGVIGLEFDSEVLVNQAPTLQLANGKTATFLTQYDSKTLLFAVDKEDIGQEITGIAKGSIESMHNLPVNPAGVGIPGGVNGSEAAVHEVPEYKGPLGTAGTDPAPTVEKPEYNGGVSAADSAVHEVPEYKGPLGTAGTAPTVEKPEYNGKLPIATVATTKDKTYKAPATHYPTLPGTGSKADAPLLTLGFAGLFLGLFAMSKKRNQ